jgi:hypothetical protein
MLEDLLDERLVLAVRLRTDRLGPERAQRRLIHLAHLVLGGRSGPRALHHQHESLRLPAELDELRLQPLPLPLGADVDAAVGDSGSALDALGLGRELLGGRVARLLARRKLRS